MRDSDTNDPQVRSLYFFRKPLAVFIPMDRAIGTGSKKKNLHRSMAVFIP